MGTILTCTQFASLLLFLVSLMVNIFFIYIVYSKTRQETGSYKYVLMLFSFCNIAFSASEFASKPVSLVIHKLDFLSTWILINRLVFSWAEKTDQFIDDLILPLPFAVCRSCLVGSARSRDLLNNMSFFQGFCEEL
uniref:G_PROTEIN_RECEP_F1_2 domain-containing protein n=1 Tax=Angiostrongylus cantonensis TaxID=6313 RepID=A0A0K0DHY5_ANGCA